MIDFRTAVELARRSFAEQGLTLGDVVVVGPGGWVFEHAEEGVVGPGPVFVSHGGVVEGWGSVAVGWPGWFWDADEVAVLALL